MRTITIISIFLLINNFSWADSEFVEIPTDLEQDRFQTIDIKDSKTHIPATRIRLNIAPLSRTDHGYSSTYSVKVFPFFFFNEHGSIEINLDEDCIQRIEAGETVSFGGNAINHRGAKRKITGEAVPGDLDSGDLEIIITASGFDLTFDTSYLLTGNQEQTEENISK
jgi:hypothetical protein